MYLEWENKSQQINGRFVELSPFRLQISFTKSTWNVYLEMIPACNLTSSLYPEHPKTPCCCCFSVVVSDSLWPHELQNARLFCPSLSPWVCPNSCSLSQWCHPTSSSSVAPFSSWLQFFPASGSFPMSQLFASGGQSIGASASASVLLVNIQDWFPLGLTGLISLLYKGLSKPSPAPQFESVNSSARNLLYGPTFTATRDYWKNHSFDYIDLCQQSDVSAS